MMRYVKTVAALILIMLMMSAITACSSSPQVDGLKVNVSPSKPHENSTEKPLKNRKQIVIGASMLDLKNEYILAVRDAMMKRAEELGVSLIISDGQNSEEKQISQVENFIAKKVNVIILNPTSMDNCKSAVEAANKANIPILTVNTLVANQEKCETFVGSDAVESGRLQMEYAAKLLNGAGNIVILHGQIGHEAEIGRILGTKQVLLKYPEIKVIYEQSGNWARVEGMAIIENLLENGKHIDAVLSQNDEMALGAIEALEAAGKLNETLVFGIDAIPEAIEAMQQGKMAGTVFQDANGQGAGAIDAAMKIAKKEKVEPRIFIPYLPVTKQNLKTFTK